MSAPLSNLPCVEASAQAQPVVFDAILHPYRSLSPTGFYWLMGLLALAAVTLGLTFLAMGAWPIFGLYGLDILLVYLAFRANYRSASTQWERVKLTAGELTVDQHGPKQGQYHRSTFQPAWLRVDMDDPPEHHSQCVLTSHGRSLSVGCFLSPEERLDFAKALRAALARLRGGG